MEVVVPKQTFISIFKRPYGDGLQLRYSVLQAITFGAFVFFFLWFFEPFGFNQLDHGALPLSLGFGLITVLLMLVLNILVPLVNRKWFHAESWTTGKEVFWIILNLTFIGLGNMFFFTWSIGHSPDLGFVLWFQFATWAVGVFPLLLLVLVRERYLRRRYEKSSLQFKVPLDRTVEKQEDVLNFPSENKGEALQLNAKDFLFARSADNYVEVHYQTKGGIQMVLLRNSLKQLNVNFSKHDDLFRCHKSYLVNLSSVSGISGNAQGFRLNFIGLNISIPVSRQHNDFIKERFTVGP